MSGLARESGVIFTLSGLAQGPTVARPLIHHMYCFVIVDHVKNPTIPTLDEDVL